MDEIFPTIPGFTIMSPANIHCNDKKLSYLPGQELMHFWLILLCSEEEPPRVHHTYSVKCYNWPAGKKVA